MLIGKTLTFRAIAEIAGLLLGAISMIYISRIVGPEYLGFSATTSAIMLLVSRLADGGLTPLASQRLARDDEKLNLLLSVTIPPKLVASAILIIISLLFANYSSIDLRLRYFVKISVFIVMLEACTPSWVFVALGRINIASVIRVGQALSYAVAIFIVIHSQGDWKYLPYLTLFNSFVNFALATFFLWRFKLYAFDRDVFKNNYIARVKGFYREGFNFLKADLSSYVYTTSDRLILYYFTNSYVVGIYEAAYKVINPFYAINSVITPTMFRELAQSFKLGRLYPVMAKYVFSMSIFTIPLGFLLLFFSKDVVTILYGTKFLQSTNSLMILGFVITFGFTGGIIVQPFSAWNMSREYGTSIFWGNVLNTILNFSLIPFYGAIGAALATMAAKIIVSVVGYIFFKKATDYPLAADFLYFFIASVFPLLLLFPLHQMGVNNYLLMSLYGVVYLFCATLLYRWRFRRLLV
jgi:O-antigen/teichoic acid export membrane protein